jgi:hypothetical protein
MAAFAASQWAEAEDIATTKAYSPDCICPLEKVLLFSFHRLGNGLTEFELLACSLNMMDSRFKCCLTPQLVFLTTVRRIA